MPVPWWLTSVNRSCVLIVGSLALRMPVEQIVFAHVSDPHFAADRVSPDAVRALGQDGHDLLLCQALPEALEDLRDRTGMADGSRLPLVMSGDLTRTGQTPEEFETGREYFESTWPNPDQLPTRRYGLDLGTRSVLMIPGNHDHWDGDTQNMWGYNGAIKPLFFPRTPFLRTLRSPSRRLIVELYGLDSCSGFSPIGVGGNVRARGLIADEELNKLTRLLAVSASRFPNDRGAVERCVRVFVCHHSFQGNWLLGWFAGSLELHNDSQRTLRYLAGRYRVAAILTGHTHDFLADRYDIPPYTHAIREFRSATTLQAPARYFKQGFFGHRILLDGRGRVWWTAFPYQWQGSYFYPLAIEERAPRPGDWNPFHFEIT